MNKTIIALGGGGFTMEPENPLLDLYILAASDKKEPKICFLPTASGDDENYITFFGQIFSQYSCNPTYLNVLSPRMIDMEDFLLGSDIIYVGGGNTKSMLALWHAWGIDKFLKKAYDKGIILAGVSAGMVCWFEECITDSIPHKFSVLPCLGFIEGSSCPHYDGQKGRQEAYHNALENNTISNGYAVEDGVGLHFVNGKLLRAISSRENSKAYRVYREISGKTSEDIINPEFLGTEDNYKKYLKLNSED